MNRHKIFSLDKLVGAGHDVRVHDMNLGLGELYASLVRVYRPTVAVVIGSWRGFVPIVLAQAMQENVEKGKVVFIDPSLVDDFWKDPTQVQAYFAKHDAANVEHHCMTTQEFVQTNAFRALPSIGLLFVDGLHTAAQAEFDHAAFEAVLSGPALFHDSCSRMISTLYSEPVPHTVWQYMRDLRARGYSVVDIERGPGVSIVLPGK